MKPGGETVNALNADLRKQGEGRDGLSRISPPLQSIGNVLDVVYHYNRLTKAKVSDVQKHKELSCRISQKGLGCLALGQFGGLLKEGLDIYNKTNDEKQKKAYGGTRAILADSWKDIKNNAKGGWKGLWNSEVDCEAWAKKE